MIQDRAKVARQGMHPPLPEMVLVGGCTAKGPSGSWVNLIACLVVGWGS